MVIISQDNSKSCHWLILARSNVSISLEHLLLVILALTLFSLAMAIWLALQGFWPVLIFSSIQMAVVAWALYIAWRRNWVQEKIEITGDRLIVTFSSLKQSRHHVFQAAWVKVRLEPQTRNWDSPRLLLSAMGESVELGCFLNRNEKGELAKHLQTALSGCSAWNHSAQT
ncbi:MAG: DUF2244 domain-containing protein [Proteobacteria bacterium]|nr:DUF2244 domain-containing protein [Pseudomonadota bacterium]